MCDESGSALSGAPTPVIYLKYKCISDCVTIVRTLAAGTVVQISFGRQVKWFASLADTCALGATLSKTRRPYLRPSEPFHNSDSAMLRTAQAQFKRLTTCVLQEDCQRARCTDGTTLVWPMVHCEDMDTQGALKTCDNTGSVRKSGPMSWKKTGTGPDCNRWQPDLRLRSIWPEDFTGCGSSKFGMWLNRRGTGGSRLPPCDNRTTGQVTGKTTGLQDLVIATFQQPRQPPRPTAMTMATTTTTTTATTTGDYSDDDYIYGGYGHHSDDGYDDYGGQLQRRRHLWRLTNRRYGHHSHNGYDNYDDDYSNDYGNYGDDYGDTT
ncbi:hypothetical protein EDB89DRAFT_1905547 [Lactarius sanguifluus]|nr:hypothetical protein EDB89DRAFT_1905547 [Lactarius sanguifluus]